MAVEKEIIIDINTAQSVQQVRELQQQTETLSNQLNELDRSSAAYQETVQALTLSQQKLNILLGEAGNASLQTLRSSLAQLTGEQEKLSKNSQAYTTNLQNQVTVQLRLHEVNKQTQTLAGQMEKQLDNVVKVGGSLNAGFAALSASTNLFGGESEVLEKSMVKLQAAITLVQGVKGIVGLQTSIPALITGVKALTTSTIGLRTALLSTGIGAVLVLVGAFIANLDKLKERFAYNSYGMHQLNKAYAEHQATTAELNKERSHEIRLMSASGASEQEIIKAKGRAADADIQRTMALMQQYKAMRILNKTEKEHYDELNEELQGLFDLQDQLRKDYEVAEVKRKKELADQEKQKQEEAKKRAQDIAEEKRRLRDAELQQIEEISRHISDAELTDHQLRMKELKDTYQEQLALFEKHGVDSIDLTLKYYDDLEKLVMEEEKRISDDKYATSQQELARLKEGNENKLQENALYIEELEAQQEQHRLDLLNAEIEGDTQRMQQAQEKIQESQEAIQEARDEQAEINLQFYEEYRMMLEEIRAEEWLTAEQRMEIEKEVQDTNNKTMLEALNQRKKMINQEMKAKEEQKKNEEKIDDERLQQKIKNLSKTSEILNNGVELVGSTTIAGKAMAIAAATVDTYKAGVSAMASTPGGPIAKTLAMGAVITSGLVTVKKMIATKIPGAADSASSVPSVSEAVAAPSVEVEDYYTPPIQQTTQLLTSTEKEELQQSQRVYVVESDIRDSLNRVAVSQSESSF